MSDIKVSVKSVAEILNEATLNIPDYQRPYKWERRHIRNLFYDLRGAICKDIHEYRLGSIIIHHNGTKLDIVDGQQRLISISLFLYAIYKDLLPGGSKKLLSADYIDISRKHAKDNYDECVSLLDLFDTNERSKIGSFLMDNCKLFVISIPKDNLAEAFQLFDSQNNRGKALDPHDLLKAYHLRAIKNPSDNVIQKWEGYVNNEKLKLKDLFDKHLFRIRRWANGSTGLNKKKYGSELRFSERFIDDFKGVELEQGDYPYLCLYKKLKESRIEFPCSITMPIINGEAFFKFVEYTYELFEHGVDSFGVENAESYLFGNYRKYSRNVNLYVNLMVYFVDRYGQKEITKEVCEKVFVWAFFPRIEADLLYDSTIANYAGNGTFRKKTVYQKMFQVLSISATPREFVSKIDTDVLNNLTAATVISKLKEAR